MTATSRSTDRKRIAVIGISNGFDGGSIMNSFAGGLSSAGLKFTRGYIQENSLQQQIDAARKAMNEADVVVFGLYGRVRSGAKNSVGIPENGAAILQRSTGREQKGHRHQLRQSVRPRLVPRDENLSRSVRRHAQPPTCRRPLGSRNAGHHRQTADLAARPSSARNRIEYQVSENHIISEAAVQLVLVLSAGDVS